MDVDLLLWLSDQVAELVCEEVLAGLEVCGCAGVVGENLADWAHASCNLLGEEVDLVEEEDEGGFFKVLGV